MTPDMQRKITTAAHAAGEVASSAMAAILETFGTGDELSSEASIGRCKCAALSLWSQIACAVPGNSAEHCLINSMQRQQQGLPPQA